MLKKSLFKELDARGLIFQVSDPKLAELLDGKCVAYAGFDPSGPSLGVGNLLILIQLMRLAMAGNKVICLIGGGTGLIGDPGGKTKERELLSLQTVEQNASLIESQVTKFFNNNGCEITIANNSAWLKELTLIEFLREIGKRVTVNQMMAKESVKRRLERPEEGISFAEFTYMLLQAYDYLYLYDNYDCNLQLGASEQWGNISQGIELIRRMRAKEVYGLTTPLLLKSDGTKFGKSEKGNLWLDPQMTSPYEFYQFWYNLPDDQAVNCMLFFSLKPIEDVIEITENFKKNPKSRLIQKELAYEMTALVHGVNQAEHAKTSSELIFSRNLKNLSIEQFQELNKNSPRAYFAYKRLLENPPLLTELAKESGLVNSISQAKRLIAQGGLYLNDMRVDNIEKRITVEDLLFDQWLVLRFGKSHQMLIVFNK
jgi:tyrosyl-tRNA synthetase